MVLIRRANEIVVGDIELGPEHPEKMTDPVHIFFWRLSGFLCGSHDLVAMFIRSREKKGLATGKPVKPVQYVSHNR